MTDTAEHSNSRNLRAQLTRQLIVAAAHREFVSRGYRATSLRDIAAASGLSHPGLLLHFATKDEILFAVFKALDDESERLLNEHAKAKGSAVGAADFVELARHNASIPGYLALYSALAGEASTSSHPAHASMRARYAKIRRVVSDGLAQAMSTETVGRIRDPDAEAVRFIAGWDGLQLIQQYLPERVDLPRALETYLALTARTPGWRPRDAIADIDTITAAKVEKATAPPIEKVDEAMWGYRVGRERRKQILVEATSLFAHEGYGDTSLREVARRVGVSTSTLLHHYGTKEELLRAVLTECDSIIEPRPAPMGVHRAAEEVRALIGGARENAKDAAQLIQLYAVLSSESALEGYAGHEYFRDRFARVIDRMTSLLRTAQEEGDLPAHRDPQFEALWLVALWDGLHYQWLYDPDALDVADQLSAHLDGVLPLPASNDSGDTAS